jgi:hypothetical protein
MGVWGTYVYSLHLQILNRFSEGRRRIFQIKGLRNIEGENKIG